MRTLCMALAVLVLLGVSQAQEAKEKPASADAPESNQKREEYRLVVGDRLEVLVIGHEAYSRELIVPPGGRLRYAPLGYVELVDRKVVDIEEEIQSRFVKMQILLDPQVSVVVMSYAERPVYLVGSTYQRLLLPVHKDMQLLQVMAMAGGWGPGDKRNVRIIRKDDKGELYSIPINAEKILAEEAWEKNIMIKPDDMIYIPPHEQLQERAWVYVLGHVRQPGPQLQMRGRAPITLTQLISVVGGFSQYAKSSAIRILRKKQGRAVIINVDFDEIIDNERDDVILQPDDLVWVPESFL
jgi:polysaccharide biosynthesis/export protein